MPNVLDPAVASESEPGRPATPNVRVVHVMTILAGMAAAVIAVIVPASWFLAASAGLRGETEIQAHLFVNQVSDMARQNPAFWNALADSADTGDLGDVDIGQSMGASDNDPVPERRRVLSVSGRVLIEASTPRPPAWPLLVSRLEIRDSTTRLGDVEVERSLRPALATTALTAFAAGLLGAGMFLVLRVAPLRLLNEAVRHASFLSAHDVLTGLPNRRLFHERLAQEVVRARHGGQRVALFYMDLDHFKIINDLLGHPAGDATLRTVAARLRACMRNGDTLARLGGDEFAIILPGLGCADDARVVAERLIAAIAPPIDLDGNVRQVGISIGIALTDPAADCDPDALMKHADMALYQSKGAGRGRLCFFAPEMNAQLRERQDMETSLSAAIETGSLLLHFQPQVDLPTGRIRGAEALVRWDRPSHGVMSPAAFIGLAEETGLIVPLGAWVLREACREATRWPGDIGIAVNVSTVQLRHAGFCHVVAEALSESGLPAARLELEVTESVLMRDTADILATLGRLRDLGVRLAMDDFGTGFSSLSYLRKFRFDKIKVDRGFIAKLDEDPNADAIVRAVVAMAEALGIRVNAEGVETEAQADALRAAGCPEAQGYLFGRPVPADTIRCLLLTPPPPERRWLSGLVAGKA